MKKLTNFKSTRVSVKIIGFRLAAIERLQVFDGENESLEADVHSFVDKKSHLTTAVLSRCVEMNTKTIFTPTTP